MKVLVKIVQVLVHQGVDRVVCNLYDFTESKTRVESQRAQNPKVIRRSKG